MKVMVVCVCFTASNGPDSNNRWTIVSVASGSVVLNVCTHTRSVCTHVTCQVPLQGASHVRKDLRTEVVTSRRHSQNQRPNTHGSLIWAPLMQEAQAKTLTPKT